VIDKTKLTDKENLLIERNPHIKVLIERLDMEAKPSPAIKLSQRISARIEYWFQNIIG